MRIVGVEIPSKKRLVIALTYIHGIGPKLAGDICKNMGFDLSKRTNTLTNEEKVILVKEIERFTIEGELRKSVMMNIKKMIAINSYKGIRHKRGLTVRGQHTHNNAKTAKKLNGKRN